MGSENAHELFWHKLFQHAQGSGTSRPKIPGTSRILLFETQGRQTFEGGHELFAHHPFAWKTPTPPGGLRTQKVYLCALFFLPEIRGKRDSFFLLLFFFCAPSLDVSSTLWLAEVITTPAPLRWSRAVGRAHQNHRSLRRSAFPNLNHKGANDDPDLVPCSP